MATPAVQMVNSTETTPGTGISPNSPRIGFTDTGIPGAGIWYTGDRLENISWNGTTTGAHAIVCIAGGSPGTWKNVTKA